MNSIDLTVEVILNSFVLSLIAAIVRVFFTRINSFSETARTFLGGILFGVLVGYLCNDFESAKSWLKVVIVVFSIFGKELYDWMVGVAKNPVKVYQDIKGLKQNEDNVN